MNATDLLLLAIVVVSVLFGLMRGLIGALASIAAWLLAGWVAFHFGAALALFFAGGDTPGPTGLLAGYALSFLGVLVFVGLVAWMLRKLVKTVGLSGVDRALGAALGLARGGFVACLLVLLMGFTAIPRESGWQESRVVPVLLPGAQWLRGWLPGWAAARVDFGVSAPHSIDIGNALALPQPGA